MWSSGEDFLPAPSLHAVLEPGLHYFEAGHFEGEKVGARPGQTRRRRREV